MAIKIDESTVKNGNIFRIVNTEKKSAANKFYWFTYVQLPDGSEVPVMLSEKEFERIKSRACKNSEDVPSKNFIVDMMD